MITVKFEIGRFLYTYDRMDLEHYVTYTGYDEADRFFIKEFCVDPSDELKACMDKGAASILFSATFLPIQYYKSVLGGKEGDYEVYAKSTFLPQRQIQLIGKDVTSRYTRRNETEYQNIARYIHAVIDAKDGNYMVFFPSHAFLNAVYEAYTELYQEEDHVRILCQQSHMSEAQREEFLEHFSYHDEADFAHKIAMDIEIEDDAVDVTGVFDQQYSLSFIGQSDELFNERSEEQPDELLDWKSEQVPKITTLLGFCVQGGIFSEGIDLKHDSLIGAIVVGTGLPQVGPEREILKKHFDKMGQDGFDYAYRYPGMNKVLQAAGRVIRTKDDAGVIALLDERFMQNSYKKMFPAEWKRVHAVGISEMYVYAKSFWESL